MSTTRHSLCHISQRGFRENSLLYLTPLQSRLDGSIKRLPRASVSSLVVFLLFSLFSRNASFDEVLLLLKVVICLGTARQTQNLRCTSTFVQVGVPAPRRVCRSLLQLLSTPFWVLDFGLSVQKASRPSNLS